MALAVPPPPNDRKRVKVYELRENDWFDRGTGFCTGQMINVILSFLLDCLAHFVDRLVVLRSKAPLVPTFEF